MTSMIGMMVAMTMGIVMMVAMTLTIVMTIGLLYHLFIYSCIYLEKDDYLYAK